jgi:ABC-2 type transport system permease protein
VEEQITEQSRCNDDNSLEKGEQYERDNFADDKGACLFISAPDSPFVRFLTLFPLTAPIPLLLRNAVGNLTTWEVLVAIPILIVSAIIVLAIAVRVFRYGALEYSRKVSLKEIFNRR